MTSDPKAPVPGSRTHDRYLDSRLQAAWFSFRAGGLRLARAARNLLDRAAGQVAPRAPVRRALDRAAWPVRAGASRTALWNLRAATEWALTAGKVQNLRVAARRLDGLVIARGSLFSFWAALGQPTRARGYVEGRELREGCMIASVGGGLCQLSNALYAAALEAGMQIVERHPHSRIVPGSLAERGLDATVFWNYIDLRFRATTDCLLQVRLTGSHLELSLRTRQAAILPTPTVPSLGAPERAHDCIGCAQEQCVRYIAPQAQAGRGAWLLDEAWPEFDQWLASRARAAELIAVPLDGARRRRPAYAWSAALLPGATLVEHPLPALVRGLSMRVLGASALATQSAARQRALLCLDGALARAFARSLTYDVTHVVVSLNLLPHLWRMGVLAGRHVTVLLSRSPLALLHGQLDRAARLHPGSATLADFRASAELIESEEAALRCADALVTPHRAVAEYARRCYSAPVEQLDWACPPVPADVPAPAPAARGVLFPASALGRKGAYEVRAACRALDLELHVLGRAQEEAQFWRGVRTRPVRPGDPWDNIGCVLLPAFVEHRPRLLLSARARGVPVICSDDCGLPADLPGVSVVRAGAMPELVATLERLMARA